MSLAPRLIAIQGIGFSPVQIATQGLLDYLAGGGATRRPKSTNTLKLRRIKEGRASALSAKTLTRGGVARGRGHDEPYVLSALPGAAVCATARSTAKARVLRAKGCATTYVFGRPAQSRAQVVDATGASVARCAGARSATFGTAPTLRAGSRVGLAPFMSFTSHGVAHAQGARNLSDGEVAAIIRATIDKRR